MSGCKFPEHHKKTSDRDHRPILIVAAAVLSALIWHKIGHAVTHAAAVAGHVAVDVLKALAILAVAAACYRVRSVYRQRRLAGPGRPVRLRLASPVGVREAGHSRWRHLPAALWARARWRWLTRNLGSAPADRHKNGKVMRPRAIVYPTRHGITARVRTVPGIGREEFEDDAGHIANYWRCHRVAVHQPKPGRLIVRGYRTDPLAAPLDASALPSFDGRHLFLGRDEFGDLRRVSLANLSGCAFSGNPGRGKTEAALALACQLAVSPLVDFYVLDGGACDWAPFTAGAAGYVADDLDAAADLLHELTAGMSQRRRQLEQDLGVRNGWKVGPSPAYRLRWLLVEEAPFYLDPAMVKGDKRREALVATCQGLIGGLLRRGRAPLHFTSLIAQKGTGAGGLPPDLRDLCGLRWSFGVATLQAASAVLGAEISQYPSLSPVGLQDQPGIATVLLPTGTSPYTLIRFPEVGEARADQIAVTLAARRAAETASSVLAGV